jgi:hypothetical protein
MQQSVEALEAVVPVSDWNYCSSLLAASERLYDAEIARRDGFITRSGFILGSGGILGAIVVAAGQLGLMHEKGGSFGIATWAVLILFLISLLYLAASLIVALGVQGLAPVANFSIVVDPFDVSSQAADKTGAGSYNIHLAKAHLLYAIDNYKLNNEIAFRLHASQVCFRNAVIVIILTGALSPLALTT